MSSIIEDLISRKIFNNRGEETIEVDVITTSGFGRASAPAGKSRGKAEVACYPQGGVDQALKAIDDFPYPAFDLINHPFLCFGDSSKTNIGEKCFIIGNALGLDPFSIADGIVRDNKYVLDLAIESMLISAPTWSGNSGSPIINSCGKVIGMICYSIREQSIEHSTMAGGATQFMMEDIVNRIIQIKGDYITKGYIGISSFSTITDFILAALRQLYPSFLYLLADNRDQR